MSMLNTRQNSWRWSICANRSCSQFSAIDTAIDLCQSSQSNATSKTATSCVRADYLTLYLSHSTLCTNWKYRIAAFQHGTMYCMQHVIMLHSASDTARSYRAFDAGSSAGIFSGLVTALYSVVSDQPRTRQRFYPWRRIVRQVSLHCVCLHSKTQDKLAPIRQALAWAP